MNLFRVDEACTEPNRLFGKKEGKTMAYKNKTTEIPKTLRICCYVAFISL